MCKTKSYVVTADSRIWGLEYEDSHEKIIIEHKLDDRPGNLARVEVKPCGCLTSTNVEDWLVEVDDSEIPDWYAADKAAIEDRLLQAVTRDFVPRLREYPGSLDLRDCAVTDLGQLTSVGGLLDLQDCAVTSLGQLTSVGGSLDLRGCAVTSLGQLTSVGGWLNLQGCAVTDLGQLTSVGDSLYLQHCAVTSLGQLTSVGSSLNLRDCAVTSLGKCKVKGIVYGL